jgi:hypothetical protein
VIAAIAIVIVGIVIVRIRCTRGMLKGLRRHASY